MLFRIFDLYQQGRELKQDPVGFGSGLGKDVVAPLLIIPAITLALFSIASMALWYWIGWGIFIFIAVVFWMGVVVVHGMNVMTSRVFGRAEHMARKQYSHMREQTGATDEQPERQTRGQIIDVDSRDGDNN